ncbi:MAG: hypothetical protein MZW92_46325 [Comamonadaceae bacterium]|nr:hypothetical protein [Comamonadaceae bacterium]
MSRMHLRPSLPPRADVPDKDLIVRPGDLERWGDKAADTERHRDRAAAQPAAHGAQPHGARGQGAPAAAGRAARAGTARQP